jgi:hypothetical protein
VQKGFGATHLLQRKEQRRYGRPANLCKPLQNSQNKVRDQEVGGSNPLAPTNPFSLQINFCLQSFVKIRTLGVRKNTTALPCLCNACTFACNLN